MWQILDFLAHGAQTCGDVLRIVEVPSAREFFAASIRIQTLSRVFKGFQTSNFLHAKHQQIRQDADPTAHQFLDAKHQQILQDADPTTNHTLGQYLCGLCAQEKKVWGSIALYLCPCFKALGD